MVEVLAITDYKNLCFNCLKKGSVVNFRISGRGYGSDFDNEDTFIQLCEDCSKLVSKEWFNELPTFEDEYVENYKFEENIIEFIKSLPLQGRELVENTLSRDCYKMEAQDYIDMKLGILPDFKYKEYHMYSPSEKNAYNKRFISCNNPINIIYSDGSKTCRCVFGASGMSGQKLSPNISSECSKCKYYVERYEGIKTLNLDLFIQYEAYYIGKINYNMYKHKFE